MGVAHAFTTRLGGVSGDGGDVMDLNPGGDPAHLAENLSRLRTAIGVSDRAAVLVSQVHGSTVHVPPDTADPADRCEADAIVSGDRGAMLVIRVADCVPVLLSGPGGRIVGAVHAGWRGIVGGVVERAVDVMRDRFGASPGEITAAIGPCISVAHFEVGPEVAEAFESVGLGAAIDRARSEKAHIDLPAACRAALLRHGVHENRVDITDRCTYRDVKDFFSYRRDSGRTGRLAAVICPT